MQSSDDLPTVQGSSSFSLKGELSLLCLLPFPSPAKLCFGFCSLTHHFLTLKRAEPWTQSWKAVSIHVFAIKEAWATRAFLSLFCHILVPKDAQ